MLRNVQFFYQGENMYRIEKPKACLFICSTEDKKGLRDEFLSSPSFSSENPIDPEKPECSRITEADLEKDYENDENETKYLNILSQMAATEKRKKEIEEQLKFQQKLVEAMEKS